jgi:hypothetical protein
MQLQSRWASPVLALLLLSPSSPAKKKDADEPQTKKKIASSGKIVGKLLSLDKTATAFTLQVTYYEPDPARIQEYVRWEAQKKIEIARARTAVDKARALQDYNLNAQKKMLEAYKKVTKDLKFEATDDMKVRRKYLPVDYDDKGKVKKYTAAEKRKLKGPNKRLPGYTAERDDLTKDQVVMVYLAKKPKRTKTRKKGKDADDLFSQLPKVVMILILDKPMKVK